MKRTIALGASLLCAVALLAAAAAPASGAAPPPGKGLVDFGTYTCGGGVGDVDLVGPRGFKAASGWAITGETADHLTLLSLVITGTDFDGNPIDVSHTYGKKSAMTTFTCTQHFTEGTASVDITLVEGLVPSQ
jgi:hypothetical protein